MSYLEFTVLLYLIISYTSKAKIKKVMQVSLPKLGESGNTITKSFDWKAGSKPTELLK